MNEHSGPEPSVWIIELLNDRFHQHAKTYGEWPKRFPVSEQEYYEAMAYMRYHDSLIESGYHAQRGFQNILVRGTAIYVPQP